MFVIQATAKKSAPTPISTPNCNLLYLTKSRCQASQTAKIEMGDEEEAVEAKVEGETAEEKV